MTPFLVIGLPRSRTFWLSQFLSYGGRKVVHDPFLFMDSLSQLDDLFAGGADGAVDTVLGGAWRGVKRRYPDLRLMVVQRDVEDVIRSFAQFGVTGEPFNYGMRQYARTFQDPELLEEAELTVSFNDLNTFETCDRLFQACHGRRADPCWWSSLKDQNLQCDVPRSLSRFAENQAEIGRRLKELG
jgi:hypothetical protein